MSCINRGVPYGYILGPFLYILHIHELPSMIGDKVVLYADDFSLEISKEINEDIEQQLGGSLDNLNL